MRFRIQRLLERDLETGRVVTVVFEGGLESPRRRIENLAESRMPWIEMGRPAFWRRQDEW